MHLYVIDANFSTEVPEILLQHGCIPAVGKQVPRLESLVGGEEAENPFNLEPAVWFKVQVLDSISIDCNRRTVLWNAATTISNATLKGSEGETSSSSDGDSLTRNSDIKSLLRKKNKRISESMYVGGECYGYHNDFDEIFDIAQQALGDFAEGRMSGQTFNEAIFRLLHIYILPTIRLSSDDISNVEGALRLQDKHIQDVDRAILRQQDQIDAVHRDMKKLRLRFVREINEKTSDLTYADEFSRLLNKHIEHDVKDSSHELIALQESVEKLKELVKRQSKDSEGSSSSGSEEELASRREKRDNFFTSHEALLNAREELREHVRNMGTSDHVKLRGTSMKGGLVKLKKNVSSRRKRAPSSTTPLQDTYMGMQTTVESMVATIRGLTDKKVLMLSVKEAILGTLSELLQGEDTVGVDIDSTGIGKATDVLRHSRIPKQWLTLTEQVSAAMTDLANPLFQQHKQFCQKINSRCMSILEEKRLCDLSKAVSRESNPPKLGCTADGVFFAENAACPINGRKSEGPISGHVSISHDSAASCTSDESIAGSSQSSDLVSSLETSKTEDVPDTKQSGCFGGCANPRELGDRVSTVSSRQSNSLDRTPITLDDSTRLFSIRKSIGSQEIEVVLDPSKDYLVSAIDEMRSDVQTFFAEICRSLQTEMGYDENENQYRKIWQCYETHFYEETMDIIARLYEEAYMAKCENLSLALSNFTVADLHLPGQLFFHLLQDKNPPLSDAENISITDDSPEKTREFSETFLPKLTPDSGYLSAIVEEVDKRTKLVLPASSLTSGNPESQERGNVSINDSLSSDLSSDDVQRGHIPPRDINENVTGPSQLAMSTRSPTVARSASEASYVKREKVNHIRQLKYKKPLHLFTTSCNTSSEADGQQEEGVPKNTDCESSGELSPRTIKIYKPTSTTVVYDRQTWPLVTHASLGGSDSVDQATDALEVGQHTADSDSTSTGTLNLSSGDGQASPGPLTPKSPSRKSVTLQARYKQKFHDVFDSIDACLKSSTPLQKLQYLTKALREMSQQLVNVKKDLLGEDSLACTDDLIDILVLLLCNCDPKTASRLYVHITMLSDLMAPFFSGGPFSFSLVQFSVAFQFLQDQLVVKRNKITESET